MGSKGSPFYRVVVAKNTAGRDGAFIEILGTYDPLKKPSVINLNPEKALYWLMQGAQPTKTTAYLLRSEGILEKFFEHSPNAKRKYAFLDKTTGVLSKKTSMEV